MKKQKKNQNLIITIMSITIILLFYFIVNIVIFLQKPADTVLIKKGEIISYEEAEGYIIRDENIIDTSSYDGIPKPNVDDATRVASGEKIVTYMSKEKEKLNEKIAKLDIKIQEAMESKQTIFSNDVKAIDSEIEIYLYSTIKESDNSYNIYEQKNLINEKIEKKAKIVGELSPVGSQLKSLIEERTNYEKQLNDSQRVIRANRAGLVSYRIDNYEEVLTIDAIHTLTIKELKKIKIANNQIIPINNDRVKLVNNFECYIAVPVYSIESKNTKYGDSVYLRLDNAKDKFINAKVEYIFEEEKGRLIVFKVKTDVEELTKYRKIELDVVWWRDKGLKVNKDAIQYVDVTNQSGNTIKLASINIKKSSYTQNVWVKILKEVDDFVIIDNYTDKELIELGIQESVVSERATLKMYDEAIVNVRQPNIKK